MLRGEPVVVISTVIVSFGGGGGEVSLQQDIGTRRLRYV